MDRSIGTTRRSSRLSRRARSRRSLLGAFAFALLATGALLLHAATVHAGAAARAEPLIQQGKLTPPDAATAGVEAHFGSSAALSSDGSTLLIGAPRDNGARGAAWVYARGEDGWVAQGAQEGKLTAGELPAASG